MSDNIDDFLSNMQRIGEHEFKFDFTNSKRDTNLNLSQAAVSTVNGDNKIIVAVDCDEVLVNIGDKWLQSIINLPHLYQYLNDDHRGQMTMNGQLPTMSSLWRNEYYFNKWLDVTDSTHVENLLACYFDDETFYDDLVPSPFFNSLERMAHLLSEVHVITSCSTDLKAPVERSKSKFLANLLQNFELEYGIKVNVHMLPKGVSKGEFIRDNKIHFNLFVDDHVSNLIDVVKHTERDNYEIMMPSYGYNQSLFRELKALDYKYKLKATLFHNTHEYTQEEIVKAISNM